MKTLAELKKIHAADKKVADDIKKLAKDQKKDEDEECSCKESLNKAVEEGRESEYNANIALTPQKPAISSPPKPSVTSKPLPPKPVGTVTSKPLSDKPVASGMPIKIKTFTPKTESIKDYFLSIMLESILGEWDAAAMISKAGSKKSTSTSSKDGVTTHAKDYTIDRDASEVGHDDKTGVDIPSKSGEKLSDVWKHKGDIKKYKELSDKEAKQRGAKIHKLDDTNESIEFVTFKNEFCYIFEILNSEGETIVEGSAPTEQGAIKQAVRLIEASIEEMASFDDKAKRAIRLAKTSKAMSKKNMRTSRSEK